MYHSLGNNAFILRINLFDQDFMDSNNSLQEMHPQHSFFVYDKHFLKFSLIHLFIHSKTVTEYLFWTMLNTGNTTETKKQIKKKKILALLEIALGKEASQMIINKISR